MKEIPATNPTLMAISEETGMEFVTERAVFGLSLWRASARMDGKTLAYMLPGENFVRTGVELWTREMSEACLAEYLSLPGTTVMRFDTVGNERSVVLKWTLPGFENPEEVHMKAKLAGEDPWKNLQTKGKTNEQTQPRKPERIQEGAVEVRPQGPPEAEGE